MTGAENPPPSNFRRLVIGCIEANSTIEEKEKKNTIGGDQKICTPKVGEVNEGSLEEK